MVLRSRSAKSTMRAGQNISHFNYTNVQRNLAIIQLKRWHGLVCVRQWQKGEHFEPSKRNNGSVSKKSRQTATARKENCIFDGNKRFHRLPMQWMTENLIKYVFFLCCFDVITL